MWNAQVIAQSPAITINKKWRIADGRYKKNKRFMVIKSIAIRLCTSKQVGLRVRTIIGDLMGWRNSMSIQLSSGDDPIQVADLVYRECNTDTPMWDPKYGW